MKGWQIVLLGLVGLCGLGFLTNPDRAAYENYAVEQAGHLGKEQCERASGGLGVLVKEPCQAAIEAYKPQIKPLIATTTSRQNWGLFSIYRSDISIPAVNFNGRVESIGLFDRFYTYKTP
jgi:Domain of unknown function (DUF4359)